jgi:hypothetical protein
MIHTIKNLVIGGVDIRLNTHGEKGFRVRTSKNLRYNKGHITAFPALTTLDNLVADEGAVNHDNDLINQLVIP